MFYKIGKITFSDYKKYTLRMEKLVSIKINNKNGISLCRVYIISYPTTQINNY